MKLACLLAAAATAALVTAAPLAGAPPKSGKAGPAPSSSPSASADPVYDEIADGQRQLESAARFCDKSGRRLVVNFGTNKCEPCRVVTRAMHEPKFYEAFARDFISVFIDVSPGSKNLEILKRFEADPKKGLPIVVVFDGEMKPAQVTRKGEMKELAKKGDEAVQLFFTAHFPNTSK